MAETATFEHGEAQSLRLVEYQDGDLAPEERVALEAHLATCAECRGELATNLRLFPLVERLWREEPRARERAEVEALLARAQAQLDAQPPRRAPPPERRRLVPWLFGGALVGALAIALAALLLPRLPRLLQRPQVEFAPRHRPAAELLNLELSMPPRPGAPLVPLPQGHPAVLPRGGTLTVTVTRPRRDRFAAVALVQADGTSVLLSRGDAPDPCAPVCAPVSFTIAPDQVGPAGALIVAVVGEHPFKAQALRAWLPTLKVFEAGPPPPEVGGHVFDTAGVQVAP